MKNKAVVVVDQLMWVTLFHSVCYPKNVEETSDNHYHRGETEETSARAFLPLYNLRLLRTAAIRLPDTRAGLNNNAQM